MALLSRECCEFRLISVSKVTRSSPAATGDHEYTKYGFRDLLMAGSVDIVQLDVHRVTCITEWIKVAAMADALIHSCRSSRCLTRSLTLCNGDTKSESDRSFWCRRAQPTRVVDRSATLRRRRHMEAICRSTRPRTRNYP